MPARDPDGDDDLMNGPASATATWDRASARYRSQHALERRAIDAALDLADIGPGDVLADLGTGTALLLSMLAQRPRRPDAAVGVDRSPGMLAHADALPANWSLLAGEASDPPLPAGGFDVVTISYVLHLHDAAGRAALLAGARRLLRPEGRLLTITPFVGPSGRAGPVLTALARAAPRTFGGLTPFDPRPELEEAGFAVSAARFTRAGYPSLSVLATAPRP